MINLKEFHGILIKKKVNVINLTIKKRLKTVYVRRMSHYDQISIPPMLSTDRQMYLGLNLFFAFSLFSVQS